jgi:hypothetical protein
MTSILDNMKYLPKGLPIRIEEETYIQKGILSHQWGDLYMQSSDGQVRHIRHAWNSFLKYTLNPDAGVLKNLPLEDVLDHFYLDKEINGFKVRLAQVLTWPVERIKGLGLEPTPDATCPPPEATATATCPPPDATASTNQTLPEIPEEFKRLERIHLSSLLDSTMAVRVEVGTRGILQAELHPDGTFSYDDGEVEFMGLNSFELLWYYRRRFPAENDPLSDLQTWIDVESDMALGFIRFHSDTRPLLDRVKEFYADMPPLVDAMADVASTTSEPDPLCLFMAKLEDKEAIYRRELRMLEAIEEKQRVVKDLESQVMLMRTRVGI